MASSYQHSMSYLRECERQAVFGRQKAQQDMRNLLAELNAPFDKVIEAYRIMQRFSDVDGYGNGITEQISRKYETETENG